MLLNKQARILLKLDPADGGRIEDEVKKNQISKGEKPVKSAAKKEDVAPEKPTPLKKPVQPTLLEVKMDGVGKAAKRMRDALEALEVAQDEKGAASENLQKSLKRAKRLGTSYDGYHFSLKKVAAKETIAVQKPK